MVNKSIRLGLLRLHAKFQVNWTCFVLVIANFKLGLVWLRFGFAKFASQINEIRFSEAACKILAQLVMFWLSYSKFSVRFGLAEVWFG